MTSRALDHRKLAAARLAATGIQPFLGTALFALQPTSAVGLGTFAVSPDFVLFIDPVALERWSVPEVAGVLLHEVGHVVRDHAGRARSLGVEARDANRWNIAADAEINDDLITDGAVLPGHVHPRGLGLPEGRTAEQYYWALRNRRLPEIDCGSGAHSHADQVERSWPVHTEAPARPVGLSEGEQLLIRRAVAEELQRQPGTPSAGWTRWAEGSIEPRVHWRSLLRRTVHGSGGRRPGGTDWSMQRPSRRSAPPFVLPGLVSNPAPIGVIVDTSASMTDGHLAAAWSEVLAAIAAVGHRRDRVTVFSTDTVATRIPVLGKRTSLVGGGGTDLGVGIAAAVRVRPKVHRILALTDGWTPWPDSPPRCPLTIVLLRDDGPRPHTPAWADVIEVPMAELA